MPEYPAYDEGGGSGAVSSVFGRTGAVAAESGDYTAALVGAPNVYNVKSSQYGAVGNGTTNDTTAIQAAINAQQTNGGIVFFPPGTYLINGATTGAGLIMAPGTGGSWTNSTRELIIRGSGIDSTVLLSGNLWQDGGLLAGGSSGTNPNVALVDIADLTLDGNSNLNGGTLTPPASSAGSLANLPWPGTSASSTARNGKYHRFTRVRFYRTTGYGTQPTQGISCIDCETVDGGQPSASSHYDNFGSGQGDAILINHRWITSAGNYADFVASTGTIRLVMIGCSSESHGTGGIFACGQGSIIMGCNLDATSGGIGYDASTTATKTSNIVVSNNCPHMNVYGSGLSNFSYGDIVHSNVSSDQSSFENVDFQNVYVQNALQFGAVAHTPVSSPSITNAGGSFFFNGGGTIYFRPSGYGSSTGQVSISTGGVIALSSAKITGLANGSASTDAAAFGQIPTTAAQVSAVATSAVGAASGVASLNSSGLVPVAQLEAVNIQTLSSSTYTLPDVTSATQHELTLESNVTLTLPSPGVGKSLTATTIQDSTGGRTITWATPSGSIKWPGAASPTYTSTANAEDVTTFIAINDGANWLGMPAAYNVG